MKFNLSNAWLQAGVSVSTYLMASNVMAQDVGSIATSFGTATSRFSTIVSAGSYVGGAAMGMRGMLKLKAHAENPSQTGLGVGAGSVAVGAGLIGLPFIINSVLQTGGGNASTSITGGTTRF